MQTRHEHIGSLISGPRDPARDVDRLLHRKIEQWMQSIAAKALGYDAEFREFYRFHYDPDRQAAGTAREIDLEKGKADVVVGQFSKTYSKAIQSKVVTTDSAAYVNARMLKALGQLMGTGGELPPDESRWIVQVELWNPENPWPYSTQGRHDIEDMRKQGCAAIRGVFHEAWRTFEEHHIDALKKYLAIPEDRKPVLSGSKEDPRIDQVKTTQWLLEREPAVSASDHRKHPKSTRPFLLEHAGGSDKTWRKIRAVTIKVRWAFPLEIASREPCYLSSMTFTVVPRSTNPDCNHPDFYRIQCDKVSWHNSVDWRRYSLMKLNAADASLEVRQLGTKARDNMGPSRWGQLLGIVTDRMLAMYEILEDWKNGGHTDVTNEEMQQKLERWLLNIAASALGYDAELREFTRYRYPDKPHTAPRSIFPSNKSKTGDATIGNERDPYAKTIQCKAISSADQDTVNERMRRALLQLLGLGGENPRDGDRWIILAEIWNRENPWPFTIPADPRPTRAELSRQAEQIIQRQFHTVRDASGRQAQVRKLRAHFLHNESARPLKSPLTVMTTREFGDAEPMVLKDLHPKSTLPWVQKARGEWARFHSVTVKIRWPNLFMTGDPEGPSKYVSSLVFNVWRQIDPTDLNSTDNYEVRCVKVSSMASGDAVTDWRRLL
jgi:hypothetical protein